MHLDRIERDEQILVSVILCASDPELVNTSLACRTVDVSVEGMQVVSGLALPVSSRLSLRLDICAILYRLEAEVRWSRNEGYHHVGLHLDVDSPDYLAWTTKLHSDIIAHISPIARTGT